MPDSLRYTGTSPPAHVLERYPNWVPALDEEDVEGHDETTLKPEDVQTHITSETLFTAGDVLFAGGLTLPVLIYFGGEPPSGVSIYHDKVDLYLILNAKRDVWEFMRAFGNGRAKQAELWWRNQSFPATIVSRLPWHYNQRKWRIVIDADGCKVE